MHAEALSAPGRKLAARHARRGELLRFRTFAQRRRLHPAGQLQGYSAYRISIIRKVIAIMV